MPLTALSLGFLLLFSNVALSTAATNACVLLKASYPHLTFYPGSADYAYETRTRKPRLSTFEFHSLTRSRHELRGQ